MPENTATGKPLSESLAKLSRCFFPISAALPSRASEPGRPFCSPDLDDLKNFPEGGVLIAHKDSSQFIEVMARAAAIITEVGTPVSHMATLCREARVPCLVATGNVSSKIKAGEEITVDAEDRRIYRGRVKELLTYQATCCHES